ncbi:ATP-dependent helicase [Lebetimonas natsushimae]|uniref:ATP-dependent helicase n=1 Tax=Lebetimonas natsushimae TaxID=1936991 RepID=UPI000BB9605C|nr:ATP-dependent helicase [Lebetimonas natsushimae]
MPLSKLNEEQYAAATAELGHNLVIASAGTGKTSTIVGRIAYLLQNGIKPEQILLLTFTNKAANEMVERLSRFIPTAKEIEAGTFHAVSYRWLRKLNKNIVLKTPKDMKILFRSIYSKRDFNRILGEEKPYSANYLFELYSLFLNSNEKSLESFLEKKAPNQLEYVLVYESIFEEFEEVKKEHNLVDFDSLLIRMINKLKNGIDNPFVEVLVDEYQDTNPLQNEFIENVKKHLFCVGDYDQSIYAFNGADINIISTFDKRYKNSRVFTLKKNYRSYGEILAIANKVIANNPRIYPKSLEVTRGYSGEFPKVLIYNDTFEEYRDLANRIYTSTTPRDEIAVLFRNNSSADTIEAMLREKGIECKRKGGTSFFESREIKITLDILYFILNPKDIMSFVHIVEYAKGIGNSIATDLFEALMILGDGDVINGFLKPNLEKKVFVNKKTSYQLGLFDDFKELGSISRFKNLGFEDKFLENPILKHPKLSVEGAEFLYNFYLLLKRINILKNPHSIFNEVINSKVFEHITSNLAKERSRNKNGKIDMNLYEEKKEAIKRKVAILGNLLKNYSSLEKFINALVLGSSEMSEGKGVNLLTVHASKGLEFKEVYIVDLMEKRFPNIKLSKPAGGIEEERRLFYVAVTRAKDKLFFMLAKRDRIKNIEYEPSRFLIEAGYNINS